MIQYGVFQLMWKLLLSPSYSSLHLQFFKYRPGTVLDSLFKSSTEATGMIAGLVCHDVLLTFVL